MTDAVYLDHNATTAVRPEAAAAVALALAEVGNPSSVHGFGRLARRTLEEARESVAALIGTDVAQVVFTSGGTEAGNLAIRGCGRSRVLVAGVEHDCVIKAAQAVDGGAVAIPVDGDGVVDVNALADLLAADDTPAVVSVMLANNETGVIQPVAAVAEVAHRAGALVHSDAVQAIGKIPVDWNDLGVDMLSLSAHKIGGPAGAGALVIRDQVALSPLILGGGQERGRRTGTENHSGIAGFGAAAAAAMAGLDGFAALGSRRDRLEDRIRKVAPAARVYGGGAGRLPNTSCITMPGVLSETQVMDLDLAGIAVSAGSACSSGKVSISHVHAAMGADVDEASCAIRVSQGWNSTEEDIETFFEAWKALYGRLGSGDAAAA